MQAKSIKGSSTEEVKSASPENMTDGFKFRTRNEPQVVVLEMRNLTICVVALKEK